MFYVVICMYYLDCECLQFYYVVLKIDENIESNKLEFDSISIFYYISNSLINF